MTLSPAVTQQLSMHRDLSRAGPMGSPGRVGPNDSLSSFSAHIGAAHPSHRRVLGHGSSATAGLDETTERGAELVMRGARHALLLLSHGTLTREYVLQELRWCVAGCRGSGRGG
jgi:hypothetical protein